jgi:hypothetical protein
MVMARHPEKNCDGRFVVTGICAELIQGPIGILDVFCRGFLFGFVRIRNNGIAQVSTANLI